MQFKANWTENPKSGHQHGFFCFFSLYIQTKQKNTNIYKFFKL